MFKQLNGVESVVVGYSGGSVTNPTDEQVSSKKSGHAEVVHIEFDPTIISYDELLEVFWKMHDPTTVNRQGSNVGPQYRSVIFYHNDKQRTLAEQYKEKLNATHAFDRPIVTERLLPSRKKTSGLFRIESKG
jgi:peptide-methionine (S)-S-oxide reductase